MVAIGPRSGSSPNRNLRPETNRGRKLLFEDEDDYEGRCDPLS
jgi:hypothetical protein